MEAGSDGVEDGVRGSNSPPRSAALALGGGVEEVAGGSSPRPISAAPAIAAPVASGGSGGGGPGGRPRDVGTDVEAAAAGSATESHARIEAHFDGLPASYQRDVGEAKDPHRSPAFHLHCPRLNLGMKRNSGALEEGGDAAGDAPPTRSGTLYRQIYEILSFVIDKPSHLTQLPSLLSGIGLNIRVAHAFSRKNRYALNEFIVECWPIEDAESLHKVLTVLILINTMQGLSSGFGSSSTNLLLPFHTDDCQSDIDTTLLNIGEKVTSGSCGVMFQGTHDGGKIVFGILSLAYLDQNAWNKFTKEICTSREAHHANIARLLGPCTKPHQFCTTMEYMSEGSLFCFLRNEHVVLDLPTLLKLAQDGCRRTDYLRHKGTVHWNFNLADLLIDKEHVVGVGQFGLPRSKDQEKARTARTETHKSMVPEVQSCSYCESTLATIQSLDRLVPTLEKILEQLSKHSTAEQDSHGTESVGSLAAEGEEKKLMEKLNKLLVDCVFFALPQVLIFFPWYQVKSKEESNQRLSLLKLTQDANGSSSEKIAVIWFFVIFVTVWFLGLLLSQFGRGHLCTCFASAFTACAAICTIAFVDYSLCKSLPEDWLYVVLFALHFLVMVTGIVYVWSTYIKLPQLPTIQIFKVTVNDTGNVGAHRS